MTDKTKKGGKFTWNEGDITVKPPEKKPKKNGKK